MVFLTIVKKNLETLFNSKLSSLILILGPVLLIVIVGVALQDSSIKNIKAGLYSEENDSFVESFSENLRSKSFIIHRESSLEECKTNVIEGKTHVCIEIKKREENIKDYYTYDVTLYVDFSKQRIVWRIIGSVQGIVEQESYKTRQVMVEDIKTKAKRIALEVQEKEDLLTTIIINIEDVEGQITNVIKKEADATRSIREIRNNISSIKIKLQFLSDMWGEEYFNSISNNVTQNIYQIDQKLGEIHMSLDSNQPLLDSKTKLGYAKNHLVSTRDALSEIRIDLENLEAIETERITDPIVLTYRSTTHEQGGEIQKNLEFLDYLFPSFLIFFILFTSIITSAIITIRERSSDAYIRNIASKRNGINFVLSIFITCFVIIAIQTTIILLLARYFLNVDPLINLIQLIYVLIIAISIFTLIGIALGYVFNSYESTIVGAISLVLLFFIFSSTITPAETLTKTLSEIANLLPLTLLETKIRLVMIFSSTLKIFQNELISLAATLFITSMIIFVFYHFNKEKEI
jgi:ABC-type multidrug transport system permease subunit